MANAEWTMPAADLALQGLVERSFGLLQAIQAAVGKSHIGISAGTVRIEQHRLPPILQRVLILSQLVVNHREIVVRSGIARIRLLVQLKGGDAFIELSRIHVVMRHDIQLLVFAGPVSQLKCFLPVCFRKFALSQIAVHRSHARIGHGKIGIQFRRVLVERQSAQLIEHLVFHVAQAERLERLQRRCGRFRKGLVVFLHRGQ